MEREETNWIYNSGISFQDRTAGKTQRPRIGFSEGRVWWAHCSPVGVFSGESSAGAECQQCQGSGMRSQSGVYGMGCITRGWAGNWLRVTGSVDIGRMLCLRAS